MTEDQFETLNVGDVVKGLGGRIFTIIHNSGGYYTLVSAETLHIGNCSAYNLIAQINPIWIVRATHE